MRSTPLSLTLAASLLCAPLASIAQSSPDTTPAPAAPAPAPTTPAMARAAYALPWTMRPAVAPTLARIESSVAIRDDGVSAVTLLTGGYAFVPTELGVYGRIGATNFTANSNGTVTAGVTNPLLMLLWTPQLARGLRLTVFAATTLPLGTGGGTMPDSFSRSANASGILTRSAMDNALFAVDYLTPIVGLGAVYMTHGWTFQAETTVLQLVRARGHHNPNNSDAARTNFTAGLNVGYLLHRYVTASGELHYQHWINAPNLLAPTMANPNPYHGQASFEIGLRANLPVSRTILARPGISFGMGLGGRMADVGYKVVHIDLPFAF
ncbi:MAG: hypothetical protein Q8Q09_09125 [Deltaproteobacteria bacterium]|nr:hypothetical protein [Deltaproteobacteria bacterium]